MAMIQANELRIGNYFEKGDEIYQVSGYDSYGVNYKLKTCIRAEGLFTLKNINPIPLTEEWLLKFGFTRHHEDYGNGIIMLKSCVYQTKEGMIYKIYPDELGSAEMPKNARRIQFVHQLQNLFFALTGEELTIKENEKRN